MQKDIEVSIIKLTLHERSYCRLESLKEQKRQTGGDYRSYNGSSDNLGTYLKRHGLMMHFTAIYNSSPTRKIWVFRKPTTSDSKIQRNICTS
jgi:hypothetical protein